MKLDLIKELLKENGAAIDSAATTGPVITPSSWLAGMFPAVAGVFGDPVHMAVARGGRQHVSDLSDDFFAALLGLLGMPKTPTLYLAEEGRFYRFKESEGIFVEHSRQELSAILSAVMRQCAAACTADIDTTNLVFRFRLVP